MTFGSRLFQLQVQISFIVFTMDPSYFSGRHLLTVHLLSRYTSGTNLCLLVLKVAHKKNKKPVTSLDELNELKWTNPSYNWNIFYMYKIGLTADKRRQAYKGKFRSVWRNWWNYNMYVRGSWCSCRGGWHTRAPSAHHASPVLKVPGPEVVVVVCRMHLKSLHKAPHSTLLKNLWTTLKSWIHGRKAANLNTLNSAKSGQKKLFKKSLKAQNYWHSWWVLENFWPSFSFYRQHKR